MKYRYTRYTGDELEGVDLEELVSKLSDMLLSSGFDDDPRSPDPDQRMSRQDLHDAILEALLSGGLLSQETIEKLLGDPADADARGAVRWFDGGGSLQLSDTTGAKDLVDRTREIDGLHEAALQANGSTSPGQPELASAVDFALEALCAQKKISRSDDWRYSAGENGGSRRQQGRERERTARQESFDDDEPLNVPGKKKYYN